MASPHDPARGTTHAHFLTVALDDREWDQLTADAAETGISTDLLASLILAFTCRARINHAVCLALHDTTRPWREQASRADLTGTQR